MKCPNCGAEVYHGEQFCAQCGTPIENEQGSKKDSDKTMLSFGNDAPDARTMVPSSKEDNDKTVLAFSNGIIDEAKTVEIFHKEVKTVPSNNKAESIPKDKTPSPVSKSGDGWLSQRNLIIASLGLLLFCCCCSTFSLGGLGGAAALGLFDNIISQVGN